MKGLKKIALVSAIAAASAGAQAELKALDDSMMGELTGQAGLTIDLETKYTIGEFAYHDAGYVLLQDISLSGHGGSLLDNVRIEIDVAGSGQADNAGNIDNVLDYGLSTLQGLAKVHAGADAAATLTPETALGTFAAANTVDSQALALLGEDITDTNGDAVAVAVDAASTGQLAVDEAVTYADGDLKIHVTFTDAWQAGGGFAAFAGGQGTDHTGTTTGLGLTGMDLQTAYDVVARSVDFEYSIDAIGIASSAYALGTGIEKTNHTTGLDATANTTTLISDLSIKGYLGSMDIHIENKGNGFDQVSSSLGGTANNAILGATSLGEQVTAFQTELAASGDQALAYAAAAAAAATNDHKGSGDANSKIHWDTYFNVTDLDVYIDIAGVAIKDIRVNNTRGDLTGVGSDFGVAGTNALGFAHSKRDIYAVKDNVLHLSPTALGLALAGDMTAIYHDGIAINTHTKNDMDIGHLSFGDTGLSIGEIYLTDVETITNWTISAH